MSRFHTLLAAAAGAALMSVAGAAQAGWEPPIPDLSTVPVAPTVLPTEPAIAHDGPTDRTLDPYNYSLPASSYTYVPPAPVTPHGGPTDRNVDPYTYPDQTAFAPMVEQPARAESCFYEKPIFNKAGKLIGHTKVNGCAK